VCNPFVARVGLIQELQTRISMRKEECHVRMAHHLIVRINPRLTIPKPQAINSLVCSFLTASDISRASSIEQPPKFALVRSKSQSFAHLSNYRHEARMSGIQ
jgi:hypothetical protein